MGLKQASNYSTVGYGTSTPKPMESYNFELSKPIRKED